MGLWNCQTWNLTRNSTLTNETMKNNLNLTVENGYWTLNEKPLRFCSFAKKELFSHYLRMKRLKQAVPISPIFGQNPEKAKSHNHKFNFKEENPLLNFPNIETVIFVKK